MKEVIILKFNPQVKRNINQEGTFLSLKSINDCSKKKAKRIYFILMIYHKIQKPPDFKLLGKTLTKFS